MRLNSPLRADELFDYDCEPLLLIKTPSECSCMLVSFAVSQTCQAHLYLRTLAHAVSSTWSLSSDKCPSFRYLLKCHLRQGPFLTTDYKTMYSLTFCYTCFALFFFIVFIWNRCIFFLSIPPTRIVVLNLGCSLYSSWELLKISAHAALPNNEIRNSGEDTQASVFYKTLQLIPKCSQGWEPVLKARPLLQRMWTGSLSITHQAPRDAGARPHPRPPESNSVFWQDSRWFRQHWGFWCTALECKLVASFCYVLNARKMPSTQ